MGRSRAKQYWLCHGRDYTGEACGYQVPCGKVFCNSCGHEPPLHVSCPDKATAGKGGGKGSGSNKGQGTAGKGGDKGKGGRANGGAEPHNTQPSAAERQLRAQLEDQKKELARLKKEKALDKEKAEAAGAGMEVDATSETESAALAQAVEKAREELKHLEALSPAQRALVPNSEALLASAKQKLDAALEAKRATNPLKQRFDEAEKYLKRAEARRGTAVAALAEHKEALAELQRLSVQKEEAVTSAEVEVAKAEAQVAELAARFASERSGAPAASAAPPGGPAGLQPEAIPEGMVSRAFAEEKWAEREAQFAAQLEQLQNLVADGQQAGQAPSEAAPSEAADLGSLEQLEEDDAAWGKVEKDKRKAVLDRRRDRLAKEVKSSIRGLAKVSAALSPFAKK
jgi:hypothetical protein